MYLMHSRVQRGLSSEVDLVGRGSGIVKQQLHDVLVAVEAGQEQGGEAVLLLHVDQVAENE
jgi:hypothetical protein